MVLPALTDSDKIAVSMLIIMFLALTVVAMLALGIYRSGQQPQTEEDELIESVRKPKEKPTQRKPKPAAEKEPLQEWEKDGDWWKS